MVFAVRQSLHVEEHLYAQVMLPHDSHVPVPYFTRQQNGKRKEDYKGCCIIYTRNEKLARQGDDCLSQ